MDNGAKLYFKCFEKAQTSQKRINRTAVIIIMLSLWSACLSTKANYTIGQQNISLIDPYDKIERQLLIWYPVSSDIKGEISSNPWDTFLIAKNAPILSSKDKYPVVLLSHGYYGTGHDFAWLTIPLVKNNFIVIAITHEDKKVGINQWRRARDVKTILDEFDKSPLKAFAKDTVGIAGFSLGGTTALWAIGGKATKLDNILPGQEFVKPHQFVFTKEEIASLNKTMMSKDWLDKRIKRAFLMAPAWVWIFDEKSLKNIHIKTYIVAPESDHVLVTKNNAGFLARHIPNSQYKLIKGKANHFVFVTKINKKAQKKYKNLLFIDDISVNREKIQEKIANEAVRFFKELKPL